MVFALVQCTDQDKLKLLPQFPSPEPSPGTEQFTYPNAVKEPVEVRAIRVFSYPIGDGSNLLDYGINAIHWPTVESVILAELPFEAGDVIAKEDLLEAERVLRNMKTLKRARVLVDNATSDVYVYTQDAVSLLSFFFLESEDEYRRFFLSIEESNFLGRLYGFGVQYELENFIHSYNFRLSQPRVSGYPLSVQVSSGFSYFDGNVLSESASVLISKPFRYLSDRHSFRLLASSSSGSEFIMKGSGVGTFEDPATKQAFDSSYFQESTGYDVQYTYGYGLYKRIELISGFGHESSSSYFIESDQALKGTIVEQTTISDDADTLLNQQVNAYYYKVGLRLLDRNYMTRRNFRRFILTEDIEYGSFIGFDWQQTIPIQSLSSEYYLPRTVLRYIHSEKTWQYEAFASISAQYFESGAQPGWQNETRTLTNSLFWFFDSGVAAARVKYSVALNLAESNRLSFFKGFIRGFNLNQIDVRSGLVTSFEWRTEPIVTNFLAFGAVIFTDIGMLEEEVKEFYASLGVGLRAGFYRYDKNLFRLDLAVPVSANKSSNVSVSIGLSHAF